MSRALVVSGGGSRGAFAVGVIKDLIEIYQVRFNAMIGTSTGALIIPLAAAGEIHSLVKLYTTVTDDDIYIRYNLGDRINRSAVFSFEPLTEKIKTIYTDNFFERLKRGGTDIYLTTACLQTQELVVFTTAEHPPENSYYTVRKLENGEQFRRAVLASASQPVLLPPVKVNKLVQGEPFPEYQFVDGGVREFAGVGIAMDTKASEIFTVLTNTQPPVHERESFESLLPMLMRTIDLFITDVADNDLYVPNLYNDALKYIDRIRSNMKKQGVPEEKIRSYFKQEKPDPRFDDRTPAKIHLVRPEKPLGGGPGGLVFDPAEMTGMLADGRTALQDYVATLPPGWEKPA